MRDCRIIFIIIISLIQGITFANPETASTWTKDDIISLVEAHFMQIKDIEFGFEHQLSPIAEPEYKEKHSVILCWAPEENWEKRSDKSITTEAPEMITKTKQAWNGEYCTSLVEFNRKSSDSEPSRQGRISSKKAKFPGLDPLMLLGMKGASPERTFTLVDYLNGKDVIVEGNETIDGRETFVVSVNRIPSFPREESLIMKYWLDMKRGGLPLRVEMYHKGKLRRVTSDVQISEVQPGVFFPTACNVRTFGGKSRGRWSEGEINLFQVDVNSIKINQQLTKEDFAIKFEHGTHVWNDDVGIGYYQGIGLQNQQITDEIMLGDLAEDAKEAFEKKQADMEKQKPEKTPDSAPAPKPILQSGGSKTSPELNTKESKVVTSETKEKAIAPLIIGIIVLLFCSLLGFLFVKRIRFAKRIRNVN